MELLHTGCDGLTVAFKGALSAKALRQLERAKLRAQKAGKPVYDRICDMAGEVGETGAKGGYAYRFDQGPLRPLWTVKKSDDPTQWNLMARVPAQALAEFGLKECIQHLTDDLNGFDARCMDHAVNRVDFCADIQADNFVLDPAKLSVHSHSTVQRHYDDEEMQALSVVGGARISAVTIGKMPSRQVQIYDKRKEVMRSGKTHWFNFWGKSKDEVSTAWRVEVRFGKKYLKRLNIVTFDDLISKGGTLVDNALCEVRLLAEANTNENNATRSKVSSFWAFARSAFQAFLSGAMGGVQSGKVKEVIREDQKKIILAQMRGLLVNVASLKGIKEPLATTAHHAEILIHDQFSGLVDFIGGHFWSMADDAKDFYERLNKVSARYHYLERTNA